MATPDQSTPVPQVSVHQDAGEADAAGGQDSEEFSDEEVYADYAPGFAGLEEAYSDIQTIFARVAAEYPDIFYERDQDEVNPGQVEDTGLYITESDHEEDHDVQKPVAGDVEATGDTASPEGQPSMKSVAMDTSTSGAGAAPAQPMLPSTQTMLPSISKGGPVRSLVNFQSPESPIQSHDTPAEASPRRPFFSATQIRRLAESDIRHDDFADEFIRRSGQDMNKSFVTLCTDEALRKIQKAEQDDLKGQGTLDMPKPDESYTKGSSLKIIYTPPIWPHQEGLYKTLSRLPALRCLVLDDSKLKWLRDLGSMLPNLKTLSVMRCGLKSLDGALGFSNLENLFAADNNISDPSPLATCVQLRFVDLSDNEIRSLDGFAFLRGCRGLTNMKLMENEVAQRPNFHTEMHQLIPSLRDLRPRILEVHGPAVFDSYEFLDDEQYSVPGTARGTPSNTSQSRPLGDGLDSTWPEERHLREAYNPGRTGYQKRAMSSIPYTVDEMDALLEELETSGSGEPSVVDLSSLSQHYWQEGAAEEGDTPQVVATLKGQGQHQGQGQGRVSTAPQARFRTPSPTSIPTNRASGRAKTATHFHKQ